MKSKKNNALSSMFRRHRVNMIREDAESVRDKEYSKSVKMQESTQRLLPFIDVYNGCLIMKDGTFTKILEVSPTNFSLKSPAGKDAIISKFSKLLRIAPDKIRMKSVARTSNVDQFMDSLRADMQNETVDKCILRHRDQMQLVKEVSLNDSVTHRFFCILTLDPKTERTYGSSIEDRTNQLNQQAAEVMSYFKLIGNEPIEIEPGQEDYAVCENLYYMLCSKESENVSYNHHVLDILKKYCSAAQVPITTPPYIPAAEMVAPKYIDLRPSDYFVIDGKYYMVGFVPSDGFPLAVLAGWSEFLVNCGEGIDVDIFFEKRPQEEISPRLKRTISHSRVAMKENTDVSDNYDIAESAVNTGFYLQDGLRAGDQFVYENIMITVSADSLKGVREKYKALERILYTNDMLLRNPRMHTSEAFYAVMPFGWIPQSLFKKGKRNALVSDAASSYFFTSYTICDKYGIFLGLNELNQSTTVVDFFDSDKYRNANLAILGSTGAGKTFLTQCISLRMRLRHNQVFAIIPKKGEEFKPACDAVGGQYVNVSGGSRHCINIMEIRRPKDETKKLLYGDDVEESLLSQKVQAIKTFFSLHAEDITLEEMQLLDAAVMDTYRRKGITRDNDSLWDKDRPGEYKEMPVLGDLYNVLMESKETQRIARLMTPLVLGSAASFFNGPTNVDLDNQYIVFNLDTLEKALLPQGMFVVLDLVWEKTKEDKTKRKCIILDELWSLIGASTNDTAANYVLEIFKLIRGYGGMAVCSTQDLNDFFSYKDGKYGKGIINACKFKIVLGLEEEEAKSVQKALELENEEIEKVKSFQKGKGLVCVNHNNVTVDIKASDSEIELFSTDRQVLAKLAEKRKRQKKMLA